MATTNPTEAGRTVISTAQISNTGAANPAYFRRGGAQAAVTDESIHPGNTIILAAAPVSIVLGCDVGQTTEITYT